MSSPPSSSSPFMNGNANYDYPPASTSPRPPSRAYVSEFIESYRGSPAGGGREEEQRSRESSRRRFLAETRAYEGFRSLRRNPDIREVYRRRPRVLPSQHPQDSLRDTSSVRRLAPPTTSAPNTTTTSTNTRPRATPSDRRLRRLRQIREPRARAFDLTDNSNRSMNPFSFNPSEFNMDRPPPSSDTEDSPPQSKRRKFQHEPASPPPYDGFKYGREGQVVPGRLRMEIMSCDGGEFESAEDRGESLYAPSNVLLNDRSVYCSQHSQCNLLLKHIGETAFNLQKIVIKAPLKGFTAPIQEGLIFISMSGNDLLEKTAGYEIRYESPYDNASLEASETEPDDEEAEEEEEEMIDFVEAMDDPYIWEMSQARRQDQERLNSRARAVLGIGNRVPSPSSRRNDSAPRRASFPPQPLPPPPPAAQAPPNQATNNCAPADDPPVNNVEIETTPPSFNVTIENSDSDASDDDQDTTPPAVMEDRRRREVRWSTDSPSGDEDSEFVDLLRPSGSRTSAMAYAYAAQEGRRAAHRTRYGYDNPALYEMSFERGWPGRRGGILKQPSRVLRHGRKEEMMVPHAKFFIEREKNKVVISFEPAVSGKFILLKLWSPLPHGNIDIESVQFYGYSGPRFFPAIKLR